MISTVYSGNGSRNGRQEDPEVWLCIEGGRMRCFDSIRSSRGSMHLRESSSTCTVSRMS